MSTEPNAADAADDGQGLPAEMVQDDAGGAAAADPQQEAFARRLGWRPKEEYSKLHPGKDDRWVDAASFIERTETEAPLLRSQLRKNVGAIDKLEQEQREARRLIKEQGEHIKELLGTSRDARQQGFEYAVDQVKERQRAAVKDADTAAYDECERELARLAGMRPGKAPPKETARQQPTAQQSAEVDPVTVAWTEENRSWFKGEAKQYAIDAEVWVMDEHPNLVGPAHAAERLAKVKERVQRRFPEKFENGARSQPSPTARPGPQGARPPVKKQRTVADLDADGKAALAKLKRMNPSLTDQDYLNSYKWDK